MTGARRPILIERSKRKSRASGAAFLSVWGGAYSEESRIRISMSGSDRLFHTETEKIIMEIQTQVPLFGIGTALGNEIGQFAKGKQPVRFYHIVYKRIEGAEDIMRDQQREGQAKKVPVII